jgi:hypothetical protein
MDWFPAVMTLVGVLVGVGVQEFRIWREKKDKYKDMVFEKRLDAHQGAYCWCMRLFDVMLPNKLMRGEGVRVAMKEASEALDWWDKNALYLDEDSRIKMNIFIQYMCETVYKYVDETGRKNISIEEETRKLLQNSREVVSSIKRGVGVKYLPEPRISSVTLAGMKSLDELVERMAELAREQMK